MSIREACRKIGVIHAMALLERIMTIYEGNILPIKVSGASNLKQDRIVSVVWQPGIGSRPCMGQ